MISLGSMFSGAFQSPSPEVFGVPFLMIAASFVGVIVLSSFIITRLVRVLVEHK